MQSSDEGTEGAHLPHETKVAVPQVQSGQDAGAQAVRFKVARTNTISSLGAHDLIEPPQIGKRLCWRRCLDVYLVDGTYELFRSSQRTIAGCTENVN
jgi:hypothetical protein